MSVTNTKNTNYKRDMQLYSPEANSLYLRLCKINNNIRAGRIANLKKYENTLYLYKYKGINNIFSHIQSILFAFKKKYIALNTDEYYNIMYCGSILMAANFDKKNNYYTGLQAVNKLHFNEKGGMLDEVSVKDTENYKFMMGLYFLNYINQFIPHDFKNNYICDIDDFIKQCYTGNNSINDNNTMRLIYSNLKKIVYVKKYPYGIDSKIFGIMLDHWKSDNYLIKEIPATYIKSDAVISDKDFFAFEVSKRDIDIVFGIYLHIAKEVAVSDTLDDLDIITITNTDIIVDDTEPYTIIKNDEHISSDEAEEYVQDDDFS